MFPKNKKDHYNNVAALRCVLSGGPATIHHCHGRSVGARLVSMGLDGTSGVARRGYSDALVLPLAVEYHTGARGIDFLGVDLWEVMYGTQPDLLDQVSERVGYSLWDLHRIWTPASKILPRRR